MALSVLSIEEATKGASHPDVASTLNTLGVVLASEGDSTGALDAYLRALEIRQTALGEDHPMVATVLSNIGTVYRDTGRLDQAVSALTQAAEILEARFGREHEDALLIRRELVELHGEAAQG